VVPVVVVLLLLLLLLFLFCVYRKHQEEEVVSPGAATGHTNPVYGQGAYNPAAYADVPGAGGPIYAAGDGAGSGGGGGGVRVAQNDTYGAVQFDSAAGEPYSNSSVGVYDNASDAVYAEADEGPQAGRVAANATYMEVPDALGTFDPSAGSRMAANATYGTAMDASIA